MYQEHPDYSHFHTIFYYRVCNKRVHFLLGDFTGGQKVQFTGLATLNSCWPCSAEFNLLGAYEEESRRGSEWWDWCKLSSSGGLCKNAGCLVLAKLEEQMAIGNYHSETKLGWHQRLCSQEMESPKFFWLLTILKMGFNEYHFNVNISVELVEELINIVWWTKEHWFSSLQCCCLPTILQRMLKIYHRKW